MQWLTRFEMWAPSAIKHITSTFRGDRRSKPIKGAATALEPQLLLTCMNRTVGQLLLTCINQTNMELERMPRVRADVGALEARETLLGKEHPDTQVYKDRKSTRLNSSHWE